MRLTLFLMTLMSFCSKPSDISRGKDPEPLGQLDQAPSDLPSNEPSEDGTTEGEPSGEPAGDTAEQDVVSSEETIAQAKKNKTLPGIARIGILYKLTHPAHRQAVLDWLSSHGGKIAFESEKFGYLDAELPWSNVDKLIKTAGKLGLDTSSLTKIELEADSMEVKKKNFTAEASRGQSSFFGPVHNAGFGAGVEKFRIEAARDLGVDPEALEGQGYKVAVYDSGIDLSRTDVFQDRIEDFILGTDGDYESAKADLEAYGKLEGSENGLPEGLESIAGNPTLRFAIFDESKLGDVNGNGQIDAIHVAVYQKAGTWFARVRPSKDLPFGVEVGDFGTTAPMSRRLVDLGSGQYYRRDFFRPIESAAAGIKFRVRDETVQVALVGMNQVGQHGIANLHMVGGDYRDPERAVRYKGIAPQVRFDAVRPWSGNASTYGEYWIPLARSILIAAENGNHVLDLDIYTPGHRFSDDLLSHLLCRITSKTDIVPVVAAHNYGPTPSTIQSLAQSPCVLGIGASVTKSALSDGYGSGRTSPRLVREEDLQTTDYSGRGFAGNGLLKPDIISPAYAYTAYGDKFTRFGGTSGATPATAGMVILLKQAAKLLGDISLNLDDVRFLLQTSSLPPNSPREGYGFARLDRAWELLKTLKSRGMTSGIGLATTGQQRLSFYQRPTAGPITLSLTRPRSPGQTTGPVPMQFWLEGSSELVAFIDPRTGAHTQKLQLDLPMQGEVQTLQLAWKNDIRSLPTGDHHVLVKGVRRTFMDLPRAVDVIQPISLILGESDHQLDFPVGKLYAHDIQNVYIATQPHDWLRVSAQVSCEGSPNVTTGFRATFNGSPWGFDHAGLVASGYNPTRLGETPVWVHASDDITTIALRRYVHDCPEAVFGSLHVARYRFQLKQETSERTPSSIDQLLTLTLEGAPLSPARRDSETWALATENKRLVLRKKVAEAFKYQIPEGFQAQVTLIGVNESNFQGLLRKWDGETLSEVVTSHQHTSRGLGSSYRVRMGGPEVGLSLSGLVAGNVIEAVPMGSEAYLEVSMSGDGLPTLKLSKQVRSWDRFAQIQTSAQVDHSKGLPSEGDFYLDYDLILKRQSQPQGNGRLLEETLWRRKLRVPL